MCVFTVQVYLEWGPGALNSKENSCHPEVLFNSTRHEGCDQRVTVDTSSDAHRDDAVSNRFLQCTFRRLLQFGQQHPSDLLHAEHLLLLQIHHLKTPGVQRHFSFSIKHFQENESDQKVPCVFFQKKEKKKWRNCKKRTFIPVDPEGICARSYTKLDLAAWMQGSAKGRPWNFLKPCTVFLELVTTWKKKGKTGGITTNNKKAANVHLVIWNLLQIKPNRVKEMVGFNVPGFWLLLLWIDSFDQMIQTTCQERYSKGNINQCKATELLYNSSITRYTKGIIN